MRLSGSHHKLVLVVLDALYQSDKVLSLELFLMKLLVHGMTSTHSCL